ncbi:MAG TPA: helix-turn-helix transcriptional regulator [Kiritimatiellia bacterium]|nr:helix-turn-helix transcriptional regulator [Kiritimatiellia bacterium]
METRVGVRATFSVRIPDSAMPARKTKSNTLHRDCLCAIFASNLKRLRQQSGLKMYVAAETLGVCKSTWSQWESGKRFPSAEMLAAIAACLHVKPCLLLGAVDCKCLPPCSQSVNPKALRTVSP